MRFEYYVVYRLYIGNKRVRFNDCRHSGHSACSIIKIINITCLTVLSLSMTNAPFPSPTQKYNSNKINVHILSHNYQSSLPNTVYNSSQLSTLRGSNSHPTSYVRPPQQVSLVRPRGPLFRGRWIQAGRLGMSRVGRVRILLLVAFPLLSRRRGGEMRSSG
jgi:hypothetical protein